MGIKQTVDTGTCYYVVLNNLDKSVNVNVSSDQPGNVVACYSKITNFLRGEEEYTDPSYTKLEINKMT